MANRVLLSYLTVTLNSLNRANTLLIHKGNYYKVYAEVGYLYFQGCFLLYKSKRYEALRESIQIVIDNIREQLLRKELKD